MSISALYPDMTAARLGVSIVDGLFGFVAVLMIFYLNNIFGDFFSYATVIIIAAVAFIAGIITNAIFAKISNCPVDLKKLSVYALYPAVPAGIVTILFFIIEPMINIFAFPFNTVKFSSSFSSTFRMASIFGLAFAIFWTIVYGQILAAAKSELCEEKS